MPALCAVDGYEVLQEVSEESRSHPCIAVRSRLLLVSEYGYGGVLLILRIYLGHEVRVGAYPVVLTVAYDHGPVESQVHGLAGRNGAELGRQEIAFRYAVLLVHYAHHVELDLLRYFIVGICPASGEYVHLLSFQSLGHGLLHLVLCQVRQEVGDAEAGLVLLLAYGDLHGAPVLETHDAVEGERDREPLIFLYPAVIVCFEVGHTHALEQRIGFEIQSGAVYVADTYAGTLRYPPPADGHHDEGLPSVDHVDLVAGNVFGAVPEFFIALLFEHRNDIVHDLPLSLVAQEFLIAFAEFPGLFQERVLYLPQALRFAEQLLFEDLSFALLVFHGTINSGCVLDCFQDPMASV